LDELDMKVYAVTRILLVFAVSALSAETQPVELQLTLPFRFVAYGDTRFTDPTNTRVSNPVVRQAIVQAIADAHPAFVSIGGDISYKGDNVDDWKTWDKETAVWRERNITVYPELGNHDLAGDQKIALENYFKRFPDLQNNRYYSARVANTFFLMLDSSLDELSGPQGKWLVHEFDTLPSDVDFVCLVLHHPPYTNSSEHVLGGHSAREPEQALGAMLERRQAGMRARIVVFAGHVHNYERYEHGGVVYFVTGGGGATPVLVSRRPSDPLYGKEVNYHYLLVDVDRSKMKVTMNRLEIKDGKPVWTTPDSFEITAPAVKAAKASR
jgi:hypothetical protein